MKFQTKKGFTVLEAIVAILILSLAISGVFSAVQQALSQATIAKEQVTAFYLAQEATEVVRNKRDDNQLAILNGGSGTWLDGITSACPAGKTCTVDATNLQISSANCGAGWGSCTQNLNQDPNTYLFGYGSGTATNFKREIQIEQIGADEIAVTVQVTWSKGSINEVFKAKTFLFNWI